MACAVAGDERARVDWTTRGGGRRMIIVQTPFRISFSGGGTDLRPYYARRGFGAVISTTIQKYMYVVLHPKFDEKIRLFHYEGAELVTDLEDLRHELVRTAMQERGVSGGVEITVISDV